MSQVMDAVFENGIFKSFQKIEVKEHEKVAIRMISFGDRQNRFNRIIEKIDKKAAQYASQEIESDISDAIKEVRKEKRNSNQMTSSVPCHKR